MATVDRYAIAWSLAIVAIGVGIAFYGSQGGDLTSPTPSNITTTIERTSDTIDDTIDTAEEVLERSTSDVVDSALDKTEEAIEETSEFVEEVIEDPESVLEPSIRGEEIGTQTVDPFEDIAEEVKEESSTPITLSVSIPANTSTPGCEQDNECYLPMNIVLNTGDTVLWSNDDTAAHTVTGGSPAQGPSGIFDSGLIIAGQTYEFTFNEPGKHDYFCMVHPWMVGTIDVK